MALILYTWGNKLVKKQFMGVKPCPRCGNITEQYLKRQFFTMGVFYIPLIWIPTKRYYVCENCQTGAELDRAKYKELKSKYKKMPKRSKVLTAFKELEAIAPSLPESERVTDSVYNRITQSVKFSDEEAPFIKEMIDDYFGYAAAIAAKAQADAQAAQNSGENAQAADAAEVPDRAVAAADTATAPVNDAMTVPVIAENPLASVPAPAPGYQTIYTAQNGDGPAVVTAEQQPVRKKKWGWFAAGVLQTFVMLFGLLMLFVGFGSDLFSDGVAAGLFWIVLFGVIPVGLTVLFYYLFAKK